MSRLLTPAEVEALRAGIPGAEPFVPAPTETYVVTAELGTADLPPEAVAALEPGSIVRIHPERPGLVALVANAVVVGYGRVEVQDGEIAVRVMALIRPGARGAR